jgi:hypothetical protein
MTKMYFWQSAKQVMDVVAPAVSILATLWGGWWTYNLFIKNRQSRPKAKISHLIYSERLNDKKMLLRVELKISNIGNVLLQIQSCKTWIQRVTPLYEDQLKLIQDGNSLVDEGKHEADWGLIDGVEILYKENKAAVKKSDIKTVVENFVPQIEPGEEDFIYFDFIIDANVQTILIYSYLRNSSIRRRDFGWSLCTIYNISKQTSKEA